jgi:transposase
METLRAIPHDLWEQLPPAAQVSIRALEARVGALEAMVQALQAHSRALQEQRPQTSRNSARPPASDPPHSEWPPRPRSQRRRGGHPGQRGHPRPLLPGAAVDEVVVSTPEQCAHCQARFSGDAPQPWRHPVLERPPIPPVGTEYPWHHLVWATCGAVPRAPWPAGVPRGTAGPRGQAPGALYPGAYRLAKRAT